MCAHFIAMHTRQDLSALRPEVQKSQTMLVSEKRVNVDIEEWTVAVMVA
jgi:hypothetical protein